jgi:hypothetical protein
LWLDGSVAAIIAAVAAAVLSVSKSATPVTLGLGGCGLSCCKYHQNGDDACYDFIRFHICLFYLFYLKSMAWLIALPISIIQFLCQYNCF